MERESMKKLVFEKYQNNPIMSPDKMPINVLYTFNPGAVKHNGEYILMMDVTPLDGAHKIWIARSKDGVNFTPDPNPPAWPEPDPYHKETCVYDPRITKIGDEYFILYASEMPLTDVRLGILKTKDFVNFERISMGSEPGNRNGILFPEKIDDLYVRFDRPFGDEKNPCFMWLSFSPDLVFWGKTRPLTYKGLPFRDGHKMGGGAVPIKTDKGWLEIYHVVNGTVSGFIYTLKAMLLDLDDPSKVIGYTRNHILWPEHDYEMRGRVANVVFTCNAILEDDGMVKVYYGAADTNIGLATAKLDDIIAECLKDE